MVSRWLTRNPSLRVPAAAILLSVGAGGAWAVFAPGRSAQETGCYLIAYTEVATSRWEDVDLEETSRRYAKYFEPEALARQAERLDPDVDVDKLHRTTIRTPEGSLGALFLDNTGKVVLAAKYPTVAPFSEGLASVGTRVTEDHHIVDYGYIDRTGRLAIDPVYRGTGRFSEGLAPASKDGRCGYIDHEGRVVIPFRYSLAEEFHDGVARVWPDHDTVQFIDKSGKVLFTGEEWSVGRFSEGLLFAIHPPRPGIVPGSRWGYMDRDFRLAFRLADDRFGRCEEFHDGRAAIELSRGSPPAWGFLSTDGEIAIPGPFPQVEHFSEGLAAVNVSREPLPRWGYIDVSGDMVIEPRFLRTTPFSEGLAAALVPLEPAEKLDGDPPGGPNSKPVPGRWGYIDTQGRMVVEPRFYRAQPFENGLAHVHENPLIDGYIDGTGSFVWKLTEPKPEE